MATLGRFVRWLLIGGAGLLVLAVALLGLGYGWAQSESGRAWIVRQASGALSEPGVSEITIGRLEGSLPHAEQACREVISLPIYPELTPDQQERVVAAIARFYGR